MDKWKKRLVAVLSLKFGLRVRNHAHVLAGWLVGLEVRYFVQDSFAGLRLLMNVPSSSSSEALSNSSSIFSMRESNILRHSGIESRDVV